MQIAQAVDVCPWAPYLLDSTSLAPWCTPQLKAIKQASMQEERMLNAQYQAYWVAVKAAKKTYLAASIAASVCCPAEFFHRAWFFYSLAQSNRQNWWWLTVISLQRILRVKSIASTRNSGVIWPTGHLSKCWLKIHWLWAILWYFNLLCWPWKIPQNHFAINCLASSVKSVASRVVIPAGCPAVTINQSRLSDDTH